MTVPFQSKWVVLALSASLLLAACTSGANNQNTESATAAGSAEAASAGGSTRASDTGIRATASQSAGGQAPSNRSSAGAQWTFLTYMAADNNLEADALLSLRQMADAASSDRVNVVVQVTRDPESDIEDSVNNLGPFTTTKRLLVQHNHFAERADLGRVDSGNAATLADFVAWGVRTYPAQHYLLNIWDHGGAWQGCCQSDSFQSFIDLPSIAAALKRANAHLDVLGFDACLMVNLEVALALQPYAALMVGSEENVPGLGWDYTALGNMLARTPTMSPTDVAHAVADTYLSGLAARAPDEALYATFSAVDLTKVTAVGTAGKAFFDAANAYVLTGTKNNLSEQLARFGQVLLQARLETPAFGTDGPGDLGATLDLGLLAQNAANESGAPQVKKTAADLQSALSRAVIYKVAGTGYKGVTLSGISIATLAPGDNHKSDLTAYRRVPATAQVDWLPLVQGFDGAVTAAGSKRQPEVLALQASTRRIGPGDSTTVHGQARNSLLITDVEVGVATKLNGKSVLLSQDNRAKHLGKSIDFDFTFDGFSWYRSDGQVTEAVYCEDWRPGQRIVFGLYRQNPRNKGSEAYLVLDEASGRVVQTFETSGSRGMLGAVTPGPRSTFTPYVFDAGDEVTEIPLTSVTLKNAHFTRTHLPAGDYDIVVDATNISDNQDSNSLTVTSSAS